MSRPLLLDLFCCEGGAAAGYHRAGFDVVGVDLEPQPNYPFEFHQADALDLPFSQFELDQFDAVHASPPCQGYSTMSNRHGSTIPQLIEPVRDLLTVIGLPWVIENVAGARPHLRSPITIHGGHVGLNVYGKNDRRRIWTRKDGTELRAASLDEAREAMEMPWATWNGCREAVPPAYTEFIGHQLITFVTAECAA
jgi:DNA (cytosine-5)-methyltransferase 1